jgi:hypothetical protein
MGALSLERADAFADALPARIEFQARCEAGSASLCPPLLLGSAGLSTPFVGPMLFQREHALAIHDFPSQIKADRL